MTTPSPPTYWLQIENSPPQGPWTADDILQRLPCPPGTQLCRVGDSEWYPLDAHPDFQASPIPAEVPLSVSQAPTAQIPLPPQPPAMDWKATVVGVLIVGIMAYLAYESLRPFTPREVAERFGNAKTLEEGMKYSTPSFYPALTTLFLLDDHGDAEDDFVLTDEGTDTKNEYLIGCRGTTFDRSAGRRVPITGFITLQKPNGWKVADMTLSTYYGQPFPEPFSIAKNHRLLLEENQKSKPGSTSKRTTSPRPRPTTRPLSEDCFSGR